MLSMLSSARHLRSALQNYNEITSSHPLRWLLTSVGENIEKLEPFYTIIGLVISATGMEMLWKTVWEDVSSKNSAAI